MAAPVLSHLLFAKGQEIAAFKENLTGDDASGGFGHQAQDRKTRHALAGAGLSDKAERFPLAERKGNPVHRLDHAQAGEEVGLEISDFKQGGTHSRSPQDPSWHNRLDHA